MKPVDRRNNVTRSTLAKAAKIFIINNVSLRSSRDIQRGIFEYIDEFEPDWDLHVIQGTSDAPILETALRNGSHEMSGIILTQILEPAIMDMISASPRGAPSISRPTAGAY